jgi:hypothetical protein
VLQIGNYEIGKAKELSAPLHISVLLSIPRQILIFPHFLLDIFNVDGLKPLKQLFLGDQLLLGGFEKFRRNI